MFRQEKKEMEQARLELATYGLWVRGLPLFDNPYHLLTTLLYNSLCVEINWDLMRSKDTWGVRLCHMCATAWLKALSLLEENHIRFHIALVTLKQDKQELYNHLQNINLGQVMLEEETLQLYPGVRKRLIKKGLLQHFE